MSNGISTTELIPEELRAPRSDYNDHARETGERLSKLEAQVYSLVGNRQPGRISSLAVVCRDILSATDRVSSGDSRLSELSRWLEQETLN